MKPLLSKPSYRAAFALVTIFVLSSMMVSAQDRGPWYISLRNANTRPTYDDFHHIIEAQKLATGKNIKVGIIDKYFGIKNNADMYSGGENFTGDIKAYEEIGEHGLWMAITLREIAPGVEIYALNARNRDRDIETKAIVEAIDWAIENDIDVLTYSASSFRQHDREIIDSAVRKAIANGIVTTFIHYDLPENILPYAFFSSSEGAYSRECDVNIFHFDYNMLLIDKYRNLWENNFKPLEKLGDNPYLSFSSMSVVLAGIVAMLKEVNNELKPADYKDILVDTSAEITYDGENVKHAVDAVGAINYLKNYTNRSKE